MQSCYRVNAQKSQTECFVKKKKNNLFFYDWAPCQMTLFSEDFKLSLERLSCPAGHRLPSGAAQWHHLLRIAALRNSQTPTGSETKRVRLHKEPKCPRSSAFVTCMLGNTWWWPQDFTNWTPLFCARLVWDFLSQKEESAIKKYCCFGLYKVSHTFSKLKCIA